MKLYNLSYAALLTFIFLSHTALATKGLDPSQTPENPTSAEQSITTPAQSAVPAQPESGGWFPWLWSTSAAPLNTGASAHQEPTNTDQEAGDFELVPCTTDQPPQSSETPLPTTIATQTVSSGTVTPAPSGWSWPWPWTWSSATETTSTPPAVSSSSIQTDNTQTGAHAEPPLDDLQADALELQAPPTTTTSSTEAAPAPTLIAPTTPTLPSVSVAGRTTASQVLPGQTTQGRRRQRKPTFMGSLKAADLK